MSSHIGPTGPDVASAVWREACRHIEIDVSTGAIASLLAEAIPVQAIIVVRVDAAARTIETIATGAFESRYRPRASSVALDASAWRRTSAWLRKGETSPCHDEAITECLRAFSPPGGKAHLVALPLATDGILILVARMGAKFSAADVVVIEQLREPFAVALENDRRLHELRALREAAEADRQTLLTRLGRQAITDEVVGAHSGLRQVMERVGMVANSDVPVLILGETGTGKEVVSRAIHNRSKRSDGPFIRVNCGAIPAELIDSQLFGHEKGSFTGAVDQHQGWFERADRGTLFLDEIGELPLPAQVRLLRVLQDHQIERVGSRAPTHVDVRIVAATHRDLSAMVKTGAFREDLWYRINVFPILLPPLRERLGDIPALVRHFAQRAATRFGLPLVEPTRTDLAELAGYGWPGNIRELGAVIDRAAILGGGRALDVRGALGLGQPASTAVGDGDGPTLYEVVPERDSDRAAARPGVSAPSVTIEPLATAIRAHIERALVASRGRIEGRRGAATMLQINPHTLRGRMRKLGIDANQFRD